MLFSELYAFLIFMLIFILETRNDGEQQQCGALSYLAGSCVVTIWPALCS
jgi:hypothetical protein